MNDIIFRTQNYYHPNIDPQHYYRASNGTPLDGKSMRAMKHKDVYLSDLLNNSKCAVSFSAYRDTDNKTAAVKIAQDVKGGIVRSYNPETNLLAIDCIKKRPSRLSTMFNRTNKMRYVEPSNIIVSSISRFCLLRRVGDSRSRASPKGATPRSRSSPKGATPRSRSSPKGATPRSRSSPKGGKRRTRKR